MIHGPVKNFLRHLTDFLYPPICLACRKAIGAHGALCVTCWRKVNFIERPYCEQCGVPFAQDLGPGIISPDCLAHPPLYKRARAVMYYEEGPARQLVTRLKYGDRTELAAPMAYWMSIAGRNILKEADLLLPVPLHFRRLRQRKYNQASLLAHHLAKLVAVPCYHNVLLRSQPARSQVGLSRSQRENNVQDSFFLKKKYAPYIRDKKVILIDDVLTSGATLNASAAPLIEAGVQQVDVLIFARVSM